MIPQSTVEETIQYHTRIDSNLIDGLVEKGFEEKSFTIKDNKDDHVTTPINKKSSKVKKLD